MEFLFVKCIAYTCHDSHWCSEPWELDESTNHVIICGIWGREGLYMEPHVSCILWDVKLVTHDLISASLAWDQSSSGWSALFAQSLGSRTTSSMVEKSGREYYRVFTIARCFCSTRSTQKTYTQMLNVRCISTYIRIVSELNLGKQAIHWASGISLYAVLPLLLMAHLKRHAHWMPPSSLPSRIHLSSMWCLPGVTNVSLRSIAQDY